MKHTTRKIISIVKKVFVVTIAILCIALLTLAVVTLDKFWFGLFFVCLVIYMGFLVINCVILPALKHK